MGYDKKPEMNWVERKLLYMQHEVFDGSEFSSINEMKSCVDELVRFTMENIHISIIGT